MRDRLPFSHLLPLIDLALLVILVFVPITLTALHLYEFSKGADSVHIQSGPVEWTFPRSQIVPWSIRAVTITKAHTIMAINIPGALVQWLISVPSSESDSGWHPRALVLETWQALAFPFFALPFWWLVGCGLDGLVYKERLNWSIALIGAVLFGVLIVGRFYQDPNAPLPELDGTLPLLHALTCWTIGFATLPAAWIAQSIRQRRTIHNEGAPS